MAIENCILNLIDCNFEVSFSLLLLWSMLLELLIRIFLIREDADSVSVICRVECVCLHAECIVTLRRQPMNWKAGSECEPSIKPLRKLHFSNERADVNCVRYQRVVVQLKAVRVCFSLYVLRSFSRRA